MIFRSFSLTNDFMLDFHIGTQDSGMRSGLQEKRRQPSRPVIAPTRNEKAKKDKSSR